MRQLLISSAILLTVTLGALSASGCKLWLTRTEDTRSPNGERLEQAKADCQARDNTGDQGEAFADCMQRMGLREAKILGAGAGRESSDPEMPTTGTAAATGNETTTPLQNSGQIHPDGIATAPAEAHVPPASKSTATPKSVTDSATVDGKATTWWKFGGTPEALHRDRDECRRKMDPEAVSTCMEKRGWKRLGVSTEPGGK